MGQPEYPRGLEDMRRLRDQHLEELKKSYPEKIDRGTYNVVNREKLVCSACRKEDQQFPSGFELLACPSACMLCLDCNGRV